MEDCQENGFWSWLEEPMGEGWEDVETNKLVSLIGIILGHVAIIALILGYLWPAFIPLIGFLLMPWYNWIFIGLGVISLVFQIWGLLKWIAADAEPNAATTFRAWRTNFLAQATGAILQFIAIAVWIIIAIIANSFLLGIISFSFLIGGFLFAAAAVYMQFFLKAWWYNYDEMGMWRCDTEWSLFGDDSDYEEEEMEEEEEVEEEEPAEEETMEEEEW